MRLNFTARYGGAELLCGRTLLANPFPCKHHIVLCTLFPLKLHAKHHKRVPCFCIFHHSCCFQMIDPAGIANWSVTHVDWSEGKWHPKAYRLQDVTFDLFRNITVWSSCNPYIGLYISQLGASAWVLDIVVTMAVHWFELSCNKQWKGTNMVLWEFWLTTY